MSDIERRDYFRIEDRIHLVRTPIEKHLLSDNPYSDQFNIPKQALLISQLQAIDNDSRDLLRQVGEYNRPLSSYLKSMDDKIELLAKYIVHHDTEITKKETVNLSEGGVSFYHSDNLAVDSYIHLIMVLFPSFSSIACFGIVNSCEKIEEQPTIYRIGVEFTVLTEQDRKQIVRHIHRFQSQLIRDRTHKTGENK